MTMTKHKLFFAWQFEEEEQWLEEMAQQGLALDGVGFCTYRFRKSAPGEYRTRLELLAHSPGHPESQDYIRFVEDTGAELVGSWFRWVYFRKKRDDGDFQLYSDLPARLRQLDRILSLLAVIGGINLLCALADLLQGLLPGLLNLAVAGLALWGGERLWRRRGQLRRDQELYE